MIKVAIFDDHPSVQLGVKSILEQVPDFAVAGPADTADALFRVLSQQMVEVLLLDISMRGQEQAGLQLLPRLRQQFPQLRILMFTMHESGKFIAAAKREGAHGYLFKDATPTEMILAIRTVALGGDHFKGRAGQLLTESEQARDRLTHNGFYLTRTEKEIMGLIVKGLQTNDIAKVRNRVPGTIDRQRKDILAKARDCLDLHTMAGVAAYVVEHRLLEEG
jgi:DNA-binding NarL/FixJ family response regulator